MVFLQRDLRSGQFWTHFFHKKSQGATSEPQKSQKVTFSDTLNNLPVLALFFLGAPADACTGIFPRWVWKMSYFISLCFHFFSEVNLTPRRVSYYSSKIFNLGIFWVQGAFRDAPGGLRGAPDPQMLSTICKHYVLCCFFYRSALSHAFQMHEFLIEVQQHVSMLASSDRRERSRGWREASGAPQTLQMLSMISKHSF